jgi:DNA polymerase-1
MALHIYDAMNWFREAIEIKNLSMRTLYYQLLSSRDTNILVWEGKGGNNRRRKFYSEYKKNRVRPHVDIFATIDLFKQLLAYAPVYQVAYDGYEGDDVVAALAKEYAGKTQVAIHSTDKDFRQLSPLGIVVDSNPIKECDDQYVRLYKTLVGDPSDNIKGLQGFGPVAFGRIDHKYVLPFFEREQFTEFLPEMAFMDQKHFLHLQRDRPMISIYWKITGFFDIPFHEIAARMQLGVSSQGHAEDLMKRYLIN